MFEFKFVIKISLALDVQACKLHLSSKIRQVSKKREAWWSPASVRSIRELFHVFLTKNVKNKFRSILYIWLIGKLWSFDKVDRS